MHQRGNLAPLQGAPSGNGFPGVENPGLSADVPSGQCKVPTDPRASALRRTHSFLRQLLLLLGERCADTRHTGVTREDGEHSMTQWQDFPATRARSGRPVVVILFFQCLKRKQRKPRMTDQILQVC